MKYKFVQPVTNNKAIRFNRKALNVFNCNNLQHYIFYIVFDKYNKYYVCPCTYIDYWLLIHKYYNIIDIQSAKTYDKYQYLLS